MSLPDRSSRATRRSKLFDRATTALLLAAFAAPLADELLRADEQRGPRGRELRFAAAKPRAPNDLASLRTFSERYRAWYDDRFGLRDVLIRAHSLEKIVLFGDSPTPEVYFGPRGWIFYTGQRSVENLRGLDPMVPGELEAWRLALESHRDWCAARGIEHLFVFGPNKESIYPEELPGALNRVGPTRLDQLVRYLERRSSVRVLDLRSALIEDKRNDGPATYSNYYPLGTHWCQRGCHVAYRAILGQLLPRFPEIAPVLALDDFEAGIEGRYGDSWGRSLYVPDLLFQRALVFEPKAPFLAIANEEVVDGIRRRWVRKDDPRLPRAVVLHDSFGIGLEGWLPQHFSYWTSAQGYEFDERWVESEKPDVVLEIFVERRLGIGPPRTVGGAGARDPAGPRPGRRRPPAGHDR